MRPPQRYYRRRTISPWGKHARLELAAVIIVTVAVIATILIFIFIYHDFPFRLGEPSG